MSDAHPAPLQLEDMIHAMRAMREIPRQRLVSWSVLAAGSSMRFVIDEVEWLAIHPSLLQQIPVTADAAVHNPWMGLEIENLDGNDELTRKRRAEFTAALARATREI